MNHSTVQDDPDNGGTRRLTLCHPVTLKLKWLFNEARYPWKRSKITDHLLGRDAVDLLGIHPHEVLTAAGMLDRSIPPAAGARSVGSAEQFHALKRLR